MSGMVSEIFSSFSDVIGGLASGLKEAFMNFLYENPDATEKVISDPVKFLLIFGGVGLGMGVFWKMFGLIRGRTHA